ncbi:MAG: hypothetical protein BJ554DRAFT_5349 [Olpidium bornovanus]|uniref:Uncharacterized protein n=1 Tax=Olpidium bornovanus TaxID=278681 RepID=A0A8H8A2X2_9FUNG|nr:MAG: hypothetical protein BJ554DRAFT_5349 [Olpidium bornovanus]
MVATVTAQLGQVKLGTSNRSEIVRRPATSKAGKPCKVRANLYEIKKLPEQMVYHYDIVTRDITRVEGEQRAVAADRKLPKSKNIMILKQLGVVEKKELGNFVYDGEKNLYSSKKYPFEKKSFDVVLPPSNEGRGGTYQVKLVLVNQFDITAVLLYATKKTDEEPMEAINYLNTALTYHLSDQYLVFRRSVLLPQNASPLGGGVELWQGFFSSVRVGQGAVYINADITSCAMVEAKNVIDFCSNILRKNPNDMARGLADRERVALERRLKGLMLTTTHRGERQSRRKCSGLTRETPNQIKFVAAAFCCSRADAGAVKLLIHFNFKCRFKNEDSGQELTVTQYFKQKYNIALRFPNMPCVCWGSKARQIRMPMEVCSILPGQRYLKKLDGDQTSNVIRATVTKPNERLRKITDGIQNVLALQNNATLRELGIQVDPQQVVVEGRVLPVPSLKYGPETMIPKEGKWNLLKQKFHEPAKIPAWGVVSFGRCRVQEVERFVDAMVGVFKRVGISCGDPKPPIIMSQPQNFEDGLRRCAQAVNQKTKQNPSMVLFIMNNRNELYDSVKNFLECKIGIPSQCVLDKNVSKAQDQTCMNIAMKINAKMDGVNTIVGVASPVLQVPTMVVGADVSHAAPGSGAPSISSVRPETYLQCRSAVRQSSVNNGHGGCLQVVASFDRFAFKYGASVRLSNPRQEPISNLEEMMKERLTIFFKRNNRWPERLLVYRDGVSSGQYDVVRNEEITAIRSACKGLNISAKLTFIIGEIGFWTVAAC